MLSPSEQAEYEVAHRVVAALGVDDLPDGDGVHDVSLTNGRDVATSGISVPLNPCCWYSDIRKVMRANKKRQGNTYCVERGRWRDTRFSP